MQGIQKPKHKLKDKVEQQLKQEDSPLSHQHQITLHEIETTKFIKYQGIHRVCLHPFYEQGYPYLILSRKNSSMELWYFPTGFMGNQVPLKKIVGKNNTSIESMIWFQDETTNSIRFLTAGLHGDITEWNWSTLVPIKNGGGFSGIWCMKKVPHKNIVATACEDGKIRLYNMDDELSLITTFGAMRTNKNQSHTSPLRYLSMDFHTSSSLIFVGTEIGIDCFDMNSYTLQYRVDLNGAMCWDLVFVEEDNTLFAVDSQGSVHEIDAQFGTIVSSKSHSAYDLLSLCKSVDGKRIFITGVDGKLYLYERNQHGRYIFSNGKTQAMHDLHCVIAMGSALSEEIILSVGVDGLLHQTSTREYQKDVVTFSHPVATFPIHFSKAIDTTQGIFSFHDNWNSIYVMQVPKGIQNQSEGTPQILDIWEASSPGEWGLISYTISKDLKYVAYCTLDSCVVITTVAKNEVAGKTSRNIQTVDQLYSTSATTKITPGYFMEIMDTNKLVVISWNHQLQVYDLVTKQMIQMTSLLQQQQQQLQTVKKREVELFDSHAVHAMIKLEDEFLVIVQGERIKVLQKDLQTIEWEFKIDANVSSKKPCLIYQCQPISSSQFCLLCTNNIIYWCDVKEKDFKHIKAYSHTSYIKAVAPLEEESQFVVMEQQVTVQQRKDNVSKVMKKLCETVHGLRGKNYLDMIYLSNQELVILVDKTEAKIEMLPPTIKASKFARK